MSVVLDRRQVHPEESGLIRVTIRCGCGLEIVAIGTPDESHHDIYDTAERALSDHLATAEIEDVCRPWIGWPSMTART